MAVWTKQCPINNFMTTKLLGRDERYGISDVRTVVGLQCVLARSFELQTFFTYSRAEHELIGATTGLDDETGRAERRPATSASVGLSVLGSLSLPIGSGSDSMVKIASETIPAGVFYERFFNPVDHFLKFDPVRRDRATVNAAEKAHVAPLPEPAPTHPGEPMKMTTPAVPTPPAPPVPVQPPAAAPALEPAPVPATPSPSPTSRAPNGSPATTAPPGEARRYGADGRGRTSRTSHAVCGPF